MTQMGPGQTQVPPGGAAAAEGDGYAQDSGYTPQHSAWQQTGTAPSGWVGWIVFGGTMLILMGIFQFIEGLVAVVKSGYYVVAQNGLVINVDYTAWGWVHMALGALAVITAVGIFVGQTWARVIGVILAGISAIINLAFIPAYPLWSLLVIAFDIIVIYAFVAHGREMRTS